MYTTFHPDSTKGTEVSRETDDRRTHTQMFILIGYVYNPNDQEITLQEG